MMNRTIRHHDYLMKHLTDPAEAAAYLNAVAEDGNIRSLLEALRNVVDAQGGVGALAKKTKMSRTTLYRTLSPVGNPEVSTLDGILQVYGIRIGFFPVGLKGSSHHRQPPLRTARARPQYQAR